MRERRSELARAERDHGHRVVDLRVEKSVCELSEAERHADRQLNVLQLARVVGGWPTGRRERGPLLGGDEPVPLGLVDGLPAAARRRRAVRAEERLKVRHLAVQLVEQCHRRQRIDR